MKYIKTYEDQRIIGYGRLIHYHNIEGIEPTLRGLIRDGFDFNFYYSKAPTYGGLTSYLILLKGNFGIKIGLDMLLPSVDQDRLYIHAINSDEIEGYNWVKVDDVEAFLDAKKYNL